MVREFRPNATEQEIDEGCPTFDERNERKAKATAGVSTSTYEKLIERFQNDFEIFGYPIQTFQQFQQKYGGAD